MEEQKSFDQQLREKSSWINQMIDSYLPSEEGMTSVVARPMNYSMSVGGKRLRPMLICETFRVFGQDDSCVWPFMAAMEMVHTASLVHDDLPAIDNDQFRRGHETTHVKFGEPMAILAGDALLNRAFEVCAQGLVESKDKERYSSALQIFAAGAGVEGMLGGQSVDVYYTGQKLSADQMEFIHRNKTGALIETSMAVGAVMGGADQEELQTVREIGQKVGLAFQIRDDILDVIGSSEHLGKATHSDEKNDKTTYVTLYGMDRSLELVEQISDEAMDLLEGLFLREHLTRNDFLRELINQLIKREN